MMVALAGEEPELPAADRGMVVGETGLDPTLGDLQALEGTPEVARPADALP